MNYKQFLQAFNNLKMKYPVPPTHSLRCENAELGDYLFSVKNGYFSFDTSYSENIIYIFDSFKAVNCYDGDYVVESENCYECVDVFRVYNCAYLNYCARIYDSYFCYDCNDSHHLFGCAYLNHKEYCIFNRQYSKKEYEKKVAELLKRLPEENLAEMKKLLEHFPVTSTLVSHSENCEYTNHVHYSRNLYLCFDAAHCENSAYLYDAAHDKNCFDLYQTFKSELSYECVDCSRLYNCFFMKDCEGVSDSGFCENCYDSHHLFGCVNLRNEEYCILNKKYSKEEYEKRVKEILDSFREEALF